MRALLVAVALLLATPGLVLSQGRPFAKISIDAAGGITLDGRTVTLPELREALDSLAEWKGEVWYYRANPAGEPPPGALAVVEAIAEARLPVRFATNPDFSAFDGPAPGVEAAP